MRQSARLAPLSSTWRVTSGQPSSSICSSFFSLPGGTPHNYSCCTNVHIMDIAEGVSHIGTMYKKCPKYIWDKHRRQLLLSFKLYLVVINAQSEKKCRQNCRKNVFILISDGIWTYFCASSHTFRTKGTLAFFLTVYFLSWFWKKGVGRSYSSLVYSVQRTSSSFISASVPIHIKSDH